jgi:hypothetical protein
MGLLGGVTKYRALPGRERAPVLIHSLLSLHQQLYSQHIVVLMQGSYKF